MLTDKKCVPCEGGTPPLTPSAVSELLKQISGWTREDGKNPDGSPLAQIFKEFQFKDFAEALAFINKVGAIAESEGHHPDIFLHNWNKVRLTLTTHGIGGLSENDFILAAKVDHIG